MSLQACSNVTMEDVTVLGESFLSVCDSSLNLLLFVSGAISLSQADEVFNVLDQSVVDTHCCVVFHLHLCLRLVHLHTLIFPFTDNSCSICCSSRYVLAHMSMSSANRDG